MSDLKPDENPVPPLGGNAGGAVGQRDESAAADEPLRGLYKMSTTAGLGSADYVAINWLSVVALLLGLLSALSLAGAAMLVVPLAAIVCAILALWQIRSSNGTQSGRLLSIGALALAVGFGGYAVVRDAQQHARERDDQQQLTAIIASLADAIKARNYDKAYALFSDRFAQRVSRNEFVQKWKPLENPKLLGELKSIEGNGEYRFELDPTSDSRFGRTLLVLKFDKAEVPTRLDVLFRYAGEKWVIDDIPGLFPPPQPGMPGVPGAPPM